MITGPRKCGKKMIAHIIANEVGATLFDLSAANIVGKYPGKDGLKMLMHLVSKVGKALQPTVILINDCHKQFVKKVAKADKQVRICILFMLLYHDLNDITLLSFKLETKRLKKALPKFMKTIKADHRILLVGTSGAPFDAPVKPLCKLYSNIIMIPRPDYASRFCNLIFKNYLNFTKCLIVFIIRKCSGAIL